MGSKQERLGWGEKKTKNCSVSAKYFRISLELKRTNRGLFDIPLFPFIKRDS